MAEVNTDIYKSIGQGNDPLKQPLAIMQLLGAVNQNKLFNQTYDSREKIGQAWKNNVGPDGKINNAGVIRDAAGAGFLAPEAVGQGISNSTNQFALDTGKLKFAQQTLGALASKPDLKTSDIAGWAANAARAGVDADTIHGVLDGVYKAGNDSKAIKKAVLSQGIMSMGTGALEGESGPVNESGVSPQISKGEAIERRSGLAPGQSQTGMVTSNAPGFEKIAGAGADAYSSAINRAGSYGQDIYPLEKALEGIQRLPPGSTGPGKDEVNTAKSFLVANLPFLPGVDKIDIDKIKDYDETKKYFLQMAGAASSRFGHGTDQALSTALSASPSTGISQLAATELTKANIALRRMEQVQALQASDPKSAGTDFSQNPSKYPAWASKWVTNVDPRAFMFDKLDDKQRDSVLKTLKTKEQKDKFNRSYHMGIQSGVMADPNAAQ